MATTIVEQSGGQQHVLLVIADGQVTRSVDVEDGKLSPQEQKTVDAIVEASKFPLSIILVGVGDEPWDMMKGFADKIPAKDFDNFQFVSFTEIMSKNEPPSLKETKFALAALMKIPDRYKATIELNMLGCRKVNSPQRVPLPPPLYGAASPSNLKRPCPSSFEPSVPHGGASSSNLKRSRTSSFGRSVLDGAASSSNSKRSCTSSFEPCVPHYGDRRPVSTAPPSTSSTYDDQLCPICLSNSKDMAFVCGHRMSCECGEELVDCPICRRPIEIRIKLY